MGSREYRNGLRNVVDRIVSERMAERGTMNSVYTSYSDTRYTLYTLQRSLLTQNYATDGIFKNIINIPIMDAMRGQPKITSNQLSTEDIDQLNEYVVERNIIETIQQFFILNNLYGGSGLLIDVLGQNFEDFLNINHLKQGDRIKFYAVDRWELSNREGTVPNQIENSLQWGEYYYYGDKINPDRLMTLRGVFAPILLRQQLNGWGLSTVEPLVEPSNAYNMGVKVLYELLSEAKIDVMKINGYNNLLATRQDDVVFDRVSLISQLKNYKSTLTMDSEDDYQQKQLSMAGIADLIRELKYEVSAAMDLPVSKIWGLQASGFSTGNEDLLKYNSKILSEVRPRCVLCTRKVLKIICKILFDFIPSDLEVEFDELSLFTQEQMELKKQNEFLRVKTLYDSKLLTSRELAEILDEKEILKKDTKMMRGELSEFNEAQEKEEEIDLLETQNNRFIQ
ncbi:hypothetical protein FACS1894152_7180 [Bacilli bacterium]|nr:hypothetical protein FACS1894152_7180 [Bacilli bacterium]